MSAGSGADKFCVDAAPELYVRTTTRAASSGSCSPPRTCPWLRGVPDRAASPAAGAIPTMARSRSLFELGVCVPPGDRTKRGRTVRLPAAAAAGARRRAGDLRDQGDRGVMPRCEISWRLTTPCTHGYRQRRRHGPLALSWPSPRRPKTAPCLVAATVWPASLLRRRPPRPRRRPAAQARREADPSSTAKTTRTTTTCCPCPTSRCRCRRRRARRRAALGVGAETHYVAVLEQTKECERRRRHRGHSTARRRTPAPRRRPCGPIQVGRTNCRQTQRRPLPKRRRASGTCRRSHPQHPRGRLASAARSRPPS